MDHQSIKSSIDSRSVEQLVFTPPQGSGPGLLLIDKLSRRDHLLQSAVAFSEEGYCTFVLPFREAVESTQLIKLVSKSLSLLREHPQQAGKVGALFYCATGSKRILESREIKFDCTAIYLSEISTEIQVAMVDADSVVYHTTKEPTSTTRSSKIFQYPECADRFFDKTDEGYNKSAASMAYSRTLALLRSKLGPIFDIQELWEQHTMFEFAERDVDKTMETMVSEPYVNHIPTMTGGVGYDNLHYFYTNFFVNSNPPDTKLIPVSRTIGIDRLVDEMIFCFTHTCEIPWMLPKLEPTGHYVEVPLVAIVNFRGDKLYHEHIYWDQASVLVQIGKIDPTLLPVAGIETAKKLVDETLPSNLLLSD